MDEEKESIKFKLNEPRDFFLLSIWFFPIILFVTVFAFSIFNLLLMAIMFILIVLWFSGFGFIYHFFKADLQLFDDKIVIVNGRRKFSINLVDICYLEKKIKYNNPLADIYYYMNLNESVYLPKRFRIISNKKYQTVIESISKIKSSLIL